MTTQPWPVAAHIGFGALGLFLGTLFTILGAPTYSLLIALIPYLASQGRYTLKGLPFHIGSDLALTKAEKLDRWWADKQREAKANKWVYHRQGLGYRITGHADNEKRRQTCLLCPDKPPPPPSVRTRTDLDLQRLVNVGSVSPEAARSYLEDQLSKALSIPPLATGGVIAPGEVFTPECDDCEWAILEADGCPVAAKRVLPCSNHNPRSEEAS